MSPIVFLPSINTDPTYPEVVIADNPVSYWRMENAYNATYVDETGNQDATSSTPVVFHEGPSLVTDSARSFRNSSSFGQRTVMSAPALAVSPLDIVGDITVEMWMEVYNLTRYAHLLQRPGSLSDAGSIVLRCIPAFGDLFLTWGSQGSVVDGSRPSSGPLSSSTTYHIVATINATTNLWELWLNNSMIDSDTVAASPVSTAQTWYIGTRSDGNDLYLANASMDEVAIYDKVLTPAQIAYHYSVGTSP